MCEIIKKYRILLGIELLLLFLLLPGCFQKEQLVFSDYNPAWDTETISYRGKEFGVQPGVYQIRVWASDLEEGQIQVSVGAGESSFRALRSNPVTLSKGREYLDFEAYAVESMDAVYVECNGAGYSAGISAIEVYHMNWGSRMAAFLFGVFCLCLNFMLCFREGILSQRISKEKQVVFWGLAACVLVTYFPYMTDYVSYGENSGLYWWRIEQVKEALLQGEQFAVNGQLCLLIPAVLRIIGFPVMTAYKMFTFIVMAGTAGIAYYSLKKCVKSEYGAFGGTALYMFAPNYIDNFYRRAAVGECLMMAFLPLVISGIYQLLTRGMKGKQYFKVALTLGIGLLGLYQAYVSDSLFTKEATQAGWSVLIPAVVAFSAGFFYGWLEKKNDVSPLVKRSVFSVVLLVAFGLAVFRVNDLAFTGKPVWLYTAESMEVPANAANNEAVWGE